MLLLLLLVQTAPDIAVTAHVEAKSVTIEKRGEARLELRADPDGGSAVKVEAPRANGRKKLRNVVVDVNASARIASGAPTSESAETAAP